MIEVKTNDLGIVLVNEENIFTFCQPILGFADYKKFALIKSSELGDSLRLLQSLDDSAVAFVLIDPDAVNQNYNPTLPKDSVEALKGEDNPLHCYLIAVIPQNFKNATVNMKSPLLFCYESSLAAQVVLDCDFPIRFELFKKEGSCQ